MADFHFIYPLWLLLIPVFTAVFYGLARYTSKSTVWDAFIDKALQPFVVSSGEGKSKHWLFWVMTTLSMLMLLALAGPSWEKRSMPGFKVNHGLVIALDLSASMLSKDIAPDRLARAKFELNDLMQLRIEGQTGLVVFAGSAFAVAPMTEDVDTITAQVEHLDPYTMPAQGSRMDLAIAVAHDLLKNAGYPTGHILLITDGTSTPSKTLKQAKKAANDGFLVSVLQIGSAEGDVIPLRGGGFLVDREGKRIKAVVDEAGLKKVASAGQGHYVASTIDDADIDKLFTFMQIDEKTSLEKTTDKKINYSENAGIWLLFPIVVLMLLLFRKGYFFVVFIIVFQSPQPVHAFDWQSLWQTPDQKAQQAFEEGDFEQSEKLFTDKQWQASSAYKKGDYATAEKLFSESDTVDAQYNRANALAKQGKYKEAIDGYKEVLDDQADHEDARANLELIEELLKKQEPPQQQNNQESQENNENSEERESRKDEGATEDNKSAEQQTGTDQQEGKEGQEGENQEASTENKEGKAQAEADEKALEELGKDQKDAEKGKGEIANLEEQSNQEEDKDSEPTQVSELEKAAFQKQFLKKVPDDPSGLWARKFKYQYRQRRQKMEQQQW